MTERCDGCGRFVAADASMDVTFSASMDLHGNVTEEETRLCVDCSPASAGT